MTQTLDFIQIGIATLVGTSAGILGTLWWARRVAQQRRRIPEHWPLDPRRMASSAESRVWRWLNRVFFDQHIMIKVPVTRFTTARSKDDTAHWFRLLSSVYCTFTVCGSDGRVVGCVDVVGPKGVSRSNRLLKLTLLSQCGIAYCVVKPNDLPALVDMRTEFLGDAAFMPGHKGRDGAMISAAQEKLRTAVDRLRHQRHPDLGRLELADGTRSGAAAESLSADSEFSSAWQQADSFVAPLDSRRATLH